MVPPVFINQPFLNYSAAFCNWGQYLMIYYPTLYCMMDECCHFCLDLLLASSTITTQSWSFWFKKVANGQSFFSILISITHPAFLCGLQFNLFSMLVFLIYQSCFARFKWNLFYLLLYAYSTNLAIFRIKFSYNLF